MKKFKVVSGVFIGFLAGMSLLSCNKGGSNTTTANNPTTTLKPTTTNGQETSSQTQTEIKFTRAVLATGANDLELEIKATVNMGIIYYILVEDGASEPTAEQIIAGVNYGEVTVVKAGNSGSESAIEETVTGLKGNQKYVLYLVGVSGDNKTSIQSKTATTTLTVNKGTGTEEDPFLISTVEDLEHVGVGLYELTPDYEWSEDAYYKLENDIDLSEKYGEGKESWIPLNIMGGVLDGAGYTISGLYINSTDSSINLGLFDTIDVDAVVKNLTLESPVVVGTGYTEEVKVDGTSIGGKFGNNIGTLAGYLKGTIENVVVNNATVTAQGSRVGGLVGRVYVDNTTTGIKDVAVSAVVTGTNRVGGVTGIVDASSSGANAATLENAKFTGTVTGSDQTLEINGTSYKIDGQYIGGIAGYYRACIGKNFYVNATVTGVKHVGGIVGFQQRRSATAAMNSDIENALFEGTVAAIDGSTSSNIGFIVGNQSTSYSNTDGQYTKLINVYYISDSTRNMTAEAPAATTKDGVSVSREELTADWINTNLPGFPFDLNMNQE